MILPSGYSIALVLLIAGLLCLGSWANLQKATGRWRFELFCFDFAAGALFIALLAALTLGSLGWDGFSLTDDLRIAGKRQELYGFIGGAVFNLGNMLLIGAVSLAGLSVAFPVAAGLAIVVSAVWSGIFNPLPNPALTFLGCAAALGAIAFSAISYRAFRLQRLLEAVREGRTKSTKKTVSLKPVTVAVIAGILIGSVAPLLDLARSGENGVGPYSLGVIFTVAMFVVTIVSNLFLMNLPLQGEPVELREYFRARWRQHLMGLTSGGMLAAGTISLFVLTRVEGPGLPGAGLISAAAQGAAVLATIWGLAYWREFAGAESKVRVFLVAMTVLLAAGAAVVSIAPFYGHR